MRRTIALDAFAIYPQTCYGLEPSPFVAVLQNQYFFRNSLSVSLLKIGEADTRPEQKLPAGVLLHVED